MSPQEQVAFDAACRTLHQLAKSTGVHEVSVFVKVDGRVSVYGATDVCTKWFALADLAPDSAHPLPGVSVTRALQPSSNAPESPEGSKQ